MLEEPTLIFYRCQCRGIKGVGPDQQHHTPHFFFFHHSGDFGIRSSHYYHNPSEILGLINVYLEVLSQNVLICGRSVQWSMFKRIFNCTNKTA